MPAAAAMKRSQAEPPMMDVSGGDAIEEEEEEEQCEQCRVCTIRTDCFSYYNIFEKLIFKKVGVAEALAVVTSMQVREMVRGVESHGTRISRLILFIYI